ncbi:MAG: M23 family metallopeptidase [Clostridia bacterium]|nr:M23 family metallopeptidase [Clostridia bacterium]
MPSKIDWHYKNSEGTYVSATSSQTTEEKITYSITGGIGLSFETPPTQCTATVEDSGRTYRVSFNDLHDLSINTKNTVKLKLTAVWKQTESSSFYGTAQYDFLVRIQNPSKFSLSSQMVSPGDWILLSCSNISDPAKIRIQSDWCSQPTVSLRGSTAYALLPIPEDTKDISLEFEVSYGASKQLFQLPLKSSPIKEPLLQKSDLLHPTLLKEEMLGECQSLIQAVTTNTNTFFIPKEAFGNPMNDGFTVGYQHNDPILIGANETLSLIGTEFCSAEETPQAVASWNHGTVIKTGASPSFGNYVIIDHGCGLRILYGHLSRGSVSIGDVVKKGDAIGFTGTGGIATGNGFLIICTVNQELIRPDAIMGKVIPF